MRRVLAAIETGGTKILAELVDGNGTRIANGRWPTGNADQAFEALKGFLTTSVPPDATLAAIGIAAFGPLVVDSSAPDYGQMRATPKAGWTGSNLRTDLAHHFAVPVGVDTDVNAAALAEQDHGAGRGMKSLAYVTVGTGIGGGLALNGHALKGALHPEIGHLPLSRHEDDDFPSICPFHADCIEGLASGSAIQKRLGSGQTLVDRPDIRAMIARYLAQLAVSLIMAWSPQRILWGGGVLKTEGLLMVLCAELDRLLATYGARPSDDLTSYCVAAQLENAGLEGARMIAQRLAAKM